MPGVSRVHSPQPRWEASGLNGPRCAPRLVRREPYDTCGLFLALLRVAPDGFDPCDWRALGMRTPGDRMHGAAAYRVASGKCVINLLRCSMPQCYPKTRPPYSTHASSPLAGVPPRRTQKLLEAIAAQKSCIRNPRSKASACK